MRLSQSAVQTRGVKSGGLVPQPGRVQRESVAWLSSPLTRAILVFVPVLCALGFEGYREVISPGAFHTLGGSVALIILVCVGAVVSARVLFSRIDRERRSGLWLGGEIARLAAVPAGSSLSTDQVLAAFLDRIVRALPTEGTAIYLVDRETGRCRRAAALGGISPVLPQEIDVDSPDIADALRSGQVLWRADFLQADDGRAANAAIVPLRAREVAFGLLVLAADRRGRLREHFDILSVAGGQIAGILDNYSLFQQTRELAEQRECLAVLQERDRLAREMHDSLAQVLGLVALKARVVQDLLDGGDLPRAKSEIADVEATADAAYADAREAILGLRGAVKGGRRLVQALEDYLRQFSRQSGLQADLEVVGDSPTSFGASAEAQLIRVVQEALTNVRKHAMASRAVVRFDAEPGYARIVIEDDGRGFVPGQNAAAAGQGYGLQTMAERVESLGGSLTIDSKPGRGTRVVVLMPVETVETDAPAERAAVSDEPASQAK
ncbi:MAG TPA: GAF domain-containing sensor histidine kinase [Solirubrobacterales bacterium]